MDVSDWNWNVYKSCTYFLLELSCTYASLASALIPKQRKSDFRSQVGFLQETFLLGVAVKAFSCVHKREGLMTSYMLASRPRAKIVIVRLQAVVFCKLKSMP